MDLYNEMDAAVAEFQRMSGLYCPAGCGMCCDTVNVEATMLEMLPAAHEIHLRGEADYWLDRLAGRQDRDICAIYMPDPGQNTAGNCSLYAWRPALCRLFGFASVIGRKDSRTLSLCKYAGQADPIHAAAAQALANQAPCFIHYAAKIYGLDPASGNRLMPVNRALNQAIEQVGLGIALAGEGFTSKSENTDTK